MGAVYNLKEGGMHEAFMNSRAKIQVIGGGFGNGKTAAACVKTIKILKDYPGANILMARETFPKLNDTLRKEFKHWCPPSMIKSFPESKNSDNTAKFTNGTNINFRYIQQQGKGQEQSTSNLLSATYDLAVVDQIEDPGITRKDFLDIMGRMRGNTVYRGLDPTMPKSGPRWIILTCNPTANWVYKFIVKPYHIYQESKRFCDAKGIDYHKGLKVDKNLLCERDAKTGEAVRTETGEVILMMDLFEAATYENKDNLGTDFIKLLESSYQGQMKDRFLLGEWAAYEGMVYPQFNTFTHFVGREQMESLYWENKRRGRIKRYIEGYDYGIASPSCYLFGYVDTSNIVHILAGFHRKEFAIDSVNGQSGQADTILQIQAKYNHDPDEDIWADPSIFVRKSKTVGTVGSSTADLLVEASHDQLGFQRGNNDIINGIAKVGTYLSIHRNIRHPYSGVTNTPLIFFCEDLEFLEAEFTTYMWAKDTSTQESVDKPIDRDDHGMDTLKYMLTDLPQATFILSQNMEQPAWASWYELPDQQDQINRHRYG